MKPRLNPYRAAPEVMQALVALESAVQASGLEQTLIDLVKTRASQINGCAYCIHMHTREARGRGETEERLYLLDAWRESSLYSDRERAALAWTEALTSDLADARSRCRLRRGPAALRRGRAGQAQPARRDYQRLEPDRDRLPLAHPVKSTHAAA